MVIFPKICTLRPFVERTLHAFWILDFSFSQLNKASIGCLTEETA